MCNAWDLKGQLEYKEQVKNKTNNEREYSKGFTHKQYI